MIPRALFTLALVLVALFAGLAIGFVNGDQHHGAQDAAAQQAGLEHEFDRGMAAGVEYQTYFCTTPELVSN